MSVEIAFVDRDLRALDRVSAEVLVCGAFAGDRPPGGVAGLVDWRLLGRLSSLGERAFLTGLADESLLVPGRPRLPFEKVVVLGWGARADFDEGAFARALERALGTIEGLQARRVALELPGRPVGAIEPSAAFTTLVTRLDERGPPLLETLSLIDDPDAQRAFADALRSRHRVRR